MVDFTQGQVDWYSAEVEARVQFSKPGKTLLSHLIELVTFGDDMRPRSMQLCLLTGGESAQGRDVVMVDASAYRR